MNRQRRLAGRAIRRRRRLLRNIRANAAATGITLLPWQINALAALLDAGRAAPWSRPLRGARDRVDEEWLRYDRPSRTPPRTNVVYPITVRDEQLLDGPRSFR